MKTEAQRVRDHFEATASGFDSYYSGSKPVLARLLDRLLRWDMRERQRLTLEACQPIAGKSVLDVGCGTGRYCMSLARAGATEVVGLDFAPAMIDMAKELAQAEGISQKCHYLCGDVLSYSEDRRFDCVLAVGVFDYVKDDRRLLTKLRLLTGGKLIATFPRAGTWRAPVRKVRLSLLGCPVYFYTKKRIQDHLLICGFRMHSLKKIGKLYFVEAT